MTSRSKNSVRNIIAGFANRIVLIVLPFIARTAILYKLGSDYLGLGSLFTSILMVLNLSELGFGSALVYSMYKPIAEGNKTMICSLLALYRKVYRYIGLFILVGGILFAPFIRTVIKGDVPNDINIYVLYFIFLLNSSISYFAFAYKKALLTAYQRNDIVSTVNTVVSICVNVIQIAILFIIPNYYFYVIVYPIFTLIDNIATQIITKRKYPDLIPVGLVPKESKSKIKEHVIGIALQKFCSTSRNSFDSIAISMFLGLTSIAIYGNYYYVMISIHAFLYQIPQAIRASVGNAVATETQEKNYNLFNSMCLIYIWISGVCTVCLLCVYQAFMEVWMGKDMLLPMSSVFLLCLYFVLLCLSDVSALYKDAAGLWWHGRFRVLIEAIANLILNFLLGWLWGINGILLATIITITFVGHGYGGWIIFHNYFTKYSFLKFAGSQFLYLLIIGFVSIVTLKICSLLTYIGVLGIILRLILSFGIANMLFWGILRFHPHYSQSIAFLKNIKKTVKK